MKNAVAVSPVVRSSWYRLSIRFTASGMRRAGIFAVSRPKLAPSGPAPPPSIMKYCGTARSPIFRMLPWKPIAAT